MSNPNSFSFNEKTLNWKGKKVDFYRSINGKFSAFYGYSTGLVPARIHIETNDKLRLRISWTEYRDTKWINFKCRTDPKTVSQSSSANSTAMSGRCTLSTPKNCTDVQKMTNKMYALYHQVCIYLCANNGAALEIEKLIRDVCSWGIAPD